MHASERLLSSGIGTPSHPPTTHPANPPTSPSSDGGKGMERSIGQFWVPLNKMYDAVPYVCLACTRTAMTQYRMQRYTGNRPPY